MTDDDVSRETPPVPESVRGVFAERWELAAAYAHLLATDGVTRGLIGPRETARLWDRHLLNCAVLTEVLPQGSSVCDIGSGAGLPGLVVAIRRPDLRVTLVEPLLRRTTFLTEVVDGLGLDNVEVLRDRADQLHGKRRFQVVTSRAVAPLPRLLAWSMPLVEVGGAMVAMKGATAHEEVQKATAELRQWHAGDVEVLELGINVIDPPTTVIRVGATESTQLGYESTQQPRAQQSRGRRSQRRGRRK
jgi:16S rRNA (guanine527-N7)-methyltransferase